MSEHSVPWCARHLDPEEFGDDLCVSTERTMTSQAGPTFHLWASQRPGDARPSIVIDGSHAPVEPLDPKTLRWLAHVHAELGAGLWDNLGALLDEIGWGWDR